MAVAAGTVLLRPRQLAEKALIMIREGLLATLAIAEFGGITFGCISIRSAWSLLILFGGLVVMTWTILLGSAIIARRR